METVVLLSDKKDDGHIDIDLDVEKLDIKAKGATYGEIKAYVKKKYGLDVTSLYIGQIKNKAGIKDRKNCNTDSAPKESNMLALGADYLLLFIFLFHYTVFNHFEQTLLVFKA